jgi:methionyl-tRNA formyltransferase
VGEVSTPLRIVFAGTSSFAVPILEALVETPYSIVAVVTQPDKPAGRGQTLQAPPVKTKALELRLPVYQPTTLKNDEARDLFKRLAPDLLVVVAYGKLLPPWLLELPRFGAVNLHGSLLPRYRGAAPIQWAVANGDSETGVCTMRLDQGLDTGPVYACETTPIDPDESIQQLSSRLASLGQGLMKRTIAGIVDGTLQATPQDQARATLAPILTKQDGIIDWNLPAGSIHNRVRAFNPWPGTRTTFRGESCKILKSRVREGMSRETCGTIVTGLAAERFVGVVCGEGMLEILELQLPNRKSQSGMDFLNGMRVQPGERFGDSL